jgi:hypothetical protein
VKLFVEAGPIAVAGSCRAPPSPSRASAVAARPSAVHVAGQYDITRNFLLPIVDA